MNRAMNLVDLHVHSTASDGLYKPQVLIERAAVIGLKYFALTDHDTIDGIAAARQAAIGFPDLTFIPGVELSTDTEKGETHVLGYFIDENDAAFLAELEKFRDSRDIRARRMVEKLAELGVLLDWNRVQEIAGEGTSIGRPHIARAMVEKGYIEKFEDAFQNYIESGGPAYVERTKMTPEEAVALILRSAGVPVLAHPFTTGEPEAMIQRLAKAGLAGMEAYYHENTPEQTEEMLGIAGRYGLLVTGGSDFHGENMSGGDLGSVEIPVEVAEDLISYHRKH